MIFEEKNITGKRRSVLCSLITSLFMCLFSFCRVSIFFAIFLVFIALMCVNMSFSRDGGIFNAERSVCVSSHPTYILQ